MVQFVDVEAARRDPKPPMHVHDFLNWRTDYVGSRGRKDRVTDTPQAFLVNMSANGTIPPHFHQVDQFQIFVSGSGSIGRHNPAKIALHYVDHHTAYGPLRSGPYGLGFFTIRAQSDPGGIYLSDPGYKERLQPTPKRYFQVEGITLSSEPVLEHRAETVIEDVLQIPEQEDGLGALMLRLGSGMRMNSTDPKRTGGQYHLVLNGSLEFAGQSYAPLSMVYVAPEDNVLEVQAGPRGLEAMVLNFPRWEAATNA